MTDEAQTWQRVEMADFGAPPPEGFGNVWRPGSDQGPGEPAEATALVVETMRR